MFKALLETMDKLLPSQPWQLKLRQYLPRHLQVQQVF